MEDNTTTASPVPLAPAPVTHVFNQYYFDLLKRLREKAREKRYDDEALSKNVLRAIKTHYLSWDRLSEEHRAFFVTNVGEAVFQEFEALEDASAEKLRDWCLEESREAVLLFQGITWDDAYQLLGGPGDAFLHYFTLLACLRHDLTHEQVSAVLALARGGASAAAAPAVPLPPAIPRCLERLRGLGGTSPAMVTAAEETAAAPTAGAEGAEAPALGGLMEEIEDTSLGRLAKEILSEVNVSELQQSMGNASSPEDIFKSLGNPDSGILKLFGTVSQKMIRKMSSGEIRQEDLLRDAMGFANKMGGLGGLGGLGNMISSIAGGAGGARGSGSGTGTRDDDDMPFDISALTSMLGGLGGLGGGAGAAGGRGGNRGGARIDQNRVSQRVRREAKVRSLRNKHQARQGGAGGAGDDAA